jgi:CheY-like chemotaxis protein
VKVLVAAHNDSVRELLVGVVAAAGHLVVAARDGDSAWTAFERDPTPLVILDADLAGVDALTVCRRIRASDVAAEAFVLVLVEDQGERLRAVLEAGADDFISVPVTRERVAARLTIAEQRIAQTQARQRAEDALARAQWLAGIGETSIALQHEINNPLAALLGHVGLLENDLIEPGEEREVLAVVAEQAHRIAGVVKRLSALRNPQSVEYLRDGSRMLDLRADAMTPPEGAPRVEDGPPRPRSESGDGRLGDLRAAAGRE